MRRRWVLVSAWVAATAVATLVAWAAVSRVAEQVAAPIALPLPDTLVAPLDSPAAPDAAGAPDPTPPADDPDPGPVTEGYRLTGGTVTVRYRSGEAELVQASPNSGFVMEINDPGPGKVDVRFRSEDHESRLVALWRDGDPQPEREERMR